MKALGNLWPILAVKIRSLAEKVLGAPSIKKHLCLDIRKHQRDIEVFCKQEESS